MVIEVGSAAVALLTSLVATNLLVGALGLVSIGHDGRDVAAGLAVALGSWHGRHDGRLGREVPVCRKGASLARTRVRLILGRGGAGYRSDAQRCRGRGAVADVRVS